MKTNPTQESTRTVVNGAADLVEIMRENIEGLFPKPGTIIRGEYIEDTMREALEKIKVDDLIILQNKNPFFRTKKK